jgi:hypothetical protein
MRCLQVGEPGRRGALAAGLARDLRGGEDNDGDSVKLMSRWIWTP